MALINFPQENENIDDFINAGFQNYPLERILMKFSDGREIEFTLVQDLKISTTFNPEDWTKHEVAFTAVGVKEKPQENRLVHTAKRKVPKVLNEKVVRRIRLRSADNEDKQNESTD